MTKLAAWYPLHKDTKDWSGNERHLTVDGASSLTTIKVLDGILGKCYGKTQNSKAENLESPPAGLNGDNAMFCFINVSDLGNDGSANGVVTNHDHEKQTGTGITLRARSSTIYRACVNTGSGIGRTYHTYYGATDLVFNTWYHIGFTWEQASRTLCIYVNGKLDYKSVGEIPSMKMDASDPVALFKWSLPYTTSSYQPAMKLQDVRIYNDIPSLREINWIAKGCMLHWNFNEQAYGSLIPVKSWIGYDTYVDINETTGTYLKLTMKTNSYIAIRPTGTFYTNRPVRVSGYAFKNGTPVNVSQLSTYDPDAPYKSDPSTGWFISVIQANNSHIIHARAGLGTPSAGDVYEFKDLRVELLESDNGNNGSVRDVTGLKHDGLATVDLPMYAKRESNLGSGCYYFENDAIYTKEKLVVGGSNMVTMATWIKTNSIGNNDYHQPIGIKDQNYEMSLTSAGEIRAGFKVDGVRKVSNYGSGLFDNQWHHIATTYDGKVIKAYIDGALVGSMAIVGKLDVVEHELSAGQYYKPKSTYSSNKLYQSDVMLFGTALSSDDIKSLARQRLTVDKKAQVHALEFVESAGNTRVSRRGQLISPNLFEHNYKPNILDYSVWNIGSTSATGFSRNGQTYENEILIDKNPHGVDDVMWRAKQQTTTTDSDGGFNTSNFDIDRTKAYRFSCWFNRKVMGNGSFYFGTHGYDAGGAVALETSSGSKNSNPYFVTGTPHKQDEWFLVVGYVYPAGTTERYFNDDGAYTKDGTQVRTASAYRWSDDAVTANARAYLYYSSNVNTQQNIYRPRVDVIDGSEPSFKDLIKCQEHTPLVHFYDENGRYQAKKFGLGKNVIAKEFIEI